MKTFGSEKAHSYWSIDLEPIAEIEPGEEIMVETRDSSDGQIDKDSSVDRIERMDFSRVNPSTGPFLISGAERGDTLQVKILDIEDLGWGWTAIIPGFGLLAGDDSISPTELNKPALKIWKSNGKFSMARFGDLEIEIFNEPFIGTIGVAPSSRGIFSIVPPRENGGNMDNRLIGSGSTLYLPVFQRGALFSLGDVHLAQGDGEVCGTAIEAPARVRLSFSLIKGSHQRLPYVLFRKKETPYREFISFSGFSKDILDASKIAVIRMVNAFSRYMDPSEAYMLASVALNLRISELVDMPNFHVSGVIPLDIIKDEDVREKIKREII
ncbi:MAG: acetamidase/formamidase family protein [Thermoplasmata archaeon]|jgi:acetamidase/formamidase|nr:acetamidase/formamidase family protein [Thermoplasmatales archaeon]PMP75403.1 MAG: acetamidase [Aciduliprofundum sp.]